MQMEPEIIELPFQCEEWITFVSDERIVNVSMVRITTQNQCDKKAESMEKFNLNINDCSCKNIRFCSFYMMLKKSKYSKVNISENSYMITFSSKVFNLDYFKSLRLCLSRNALLEYKKIECNNNIYNDYNVVRYWRPIIVYTSRLSNEIYTKKINIDRSNIGVLFFLQNKENDGLDRNKVKVLVNDKEKYSSCINFYSDTISAHFLQLNNLTLDEIANIYDNKKTIKIKKNDGYIIDFVDNIIHDILIIHINL